MRFRLGRGAVVAASPVIEPITKARKGEGKMRKWLSLSAGVALTVCAAGLCVTGIFAADRSFDDGPALGNPNSITEDDRDDESESDEPVFVETVRKSAKG